MPAPAAKPAEQPAHTPGPWSVDDSDPDNLKVVCDFFEDETPGICGDHSTAWKLSPADARLIAAVPFLLELVQLLERSVGYEIRVSQTQGDEEGARLKTVTLNLVRDAIRKATGAA